MKNNINILEALNILFLFSQDKQEILLLKRNKNKKIFPNFYTGIGGKIEFEQLEHKNLNKAVIRELEEETKIKESNLIDLKCNLLTQHNRTTGKELTLLLWYSAVIDKKQTPLYCNEGNLEWVKIKDIPKIKLIDTAEIALNYIINTPDSKGTSLAYIDVLTKKMIVYKEYNAIQ